MIRWHLGLALIIALFLLTACSITRVTNVNVENVYIGVSGNAVEVRP